MAFKLTKKTWAIIALVIIIIAIGAGYYYYTQITKPPGIIKIGVVMNLTGPWASIDEPCWKGIQLAIDEINAKGGILGREVKAICIDTKADEAEVVAAVRRLIEMEKVCIIIGYCDTHWVLTAAPVAKELGVPFITPGATHPRIPERSGAWLACFGDNAQAAAVAEYAIKELGLKKVAVWIDTACDFSVAVCTYFKDAWEHYGGTVVYEDYFETEWTDYSELVARLKSYQDRGEIDCVYIGAIPGNVGLIIKQIREGGVTVQILGEDGFDTPLLVEVAGEYAEGTIFATHVSLESPDPKVQKFVSAYKKKWGVKPENAFAALGYDAMMIVAKAIELAGSDDPKAIESALGKVTYDGVTGSVSYSPGVKVPAKSVAVLKVEGGKFKTITMLTPKYMPPPELAP